MARRCSFFHVREAILLVAGGCLWARPGVCRIASRDVICRWPGPEVGVDSL